MQEVQELRLGRERQARKGKADAEKKEADAKAAAETAKVKESEEQRQDILAQNRDSAICPTSPPTTPAQPVYASPTIASP